MEYSSYPEMKDSCIEWLGEIPEHWEIIKIKWMSRVFRGQSPRPIEDPKYFDENGKFGWVRISDVTNSNMYLNETEQTLSELGASLSVKLFPKDIFLSIAGSVGKPCINKIKCCIHDGFVYFPDYKENKKFLYYIFKTKKCFEGLGKKGTQLNLNSNIVGDIKIGLPSLSEQKSIADFLDHETKKIDKLIEKKEKLIELLEEKRQAIISKSVTKGLDPDVPMMDSGIEWLGEIPEHWDIKKLKYIVTLINEKTDDTKDEKYIGLENIESDTGKLIDFIKGEKIDGSPKKFRKDDILFGKLRPYLAKSTIAKFNGICTGELLVFRPNEGILNEFLHYLTLSNDFIEVVNSSTYGSKMPRASWDFIGDLKTPLPELEEQKSIIKNIENKVDQIISLKNKIQEQISNFKEYRQALITNAVTGKIDVRDMVEEEELNDNAS